MAVTPGFYISTDWVSKAQLYANGVELKRMAPQDRPWIRQPGNEGDLIEHAKVVDTPSGQRFGLGALVFSWPMQGLSPQMVAYLQTTYFNTALSTNNFYQRAKHNKLTVQTFNRASNVWEAYHVHARLADLKNGAELSQGGFNNLKIDFTATAIAPDGPDLSLTGAIDPAQVGVPFEVELAITNEGDEATFNNIAIVVTIPDGTSYNDIDLPSDSYIEYSVNGGTVYSESVPGDLTTITHIRVVHTAQLDTGTTLNIDIELIADTANADVDFAATVVSSGDIDDSNNSYNDTFTVEDFSPDVYSELSLWFDGQSGVYTDSLTTVAVNNDLVHTWYDRSISGAHAVQLTGGNRPTYKTGQANGKSALQFDGSTDMLTAPSSMSLSGMVATAFIVCAPTNSSSTPGAESLFSFDNQYTAYAHKVDNTTDTEAGVFYVAGASVVAFGNAQSGLQQLTFISSPTGATLYRNTALVSSGSIGTISVTTLTGGTIGAEPLSGSGIHYYNGLIYEVLIYDGVLSTDQRTNIEQYLLTKYGL